MDEEAMAKTFASLKPGVVFPPLEVKDISGATVSTNAWKGKVVLVDFWAVWCAPCVKELPEIAALYAKYHERGLEMVGVSLDDEAKSVVEFVKTHKLPWPQYCDGPDWKVQQRYGVLPIPTSFLVDRKGVIAGVGLHGEELEKAIVAALDAR
jgi:peroxiredoxin